MDFRQMIADSLFIAKRRLRTIKDGEGVAAEGVIYGDLLNDVEIVADIELGKIFRKFYAGQACTGVLTVEGQRDEQIGNGECWICIDPLDGSLNYARRGLTLGLPYTACITIFDRFLGAKFCNIIAAGVIDLRNGDIWVSVLKPTGSFRSTLNGYVLQHDQDCTLDIGSNIVFGEMYYPENRELLFNLFHGQKGYLRNPGSAAYEMAMVASGNAVAYICDRQKCHELGAAYALVKGSGGVVVDIYGNPLDDVDFIFNSQQSVVLAINQAIADEIVAALKK